MDWCVFFWCPGKACTIVSVWSGHVPGVCSICTIVLSWTYCLLQCICLTGFSHWPNPGLLDDENCFALVFCYIRPWLSFMILFSVGEATKNIQWNTDCCIWAAVACLLLAHGSSHPILLFQHLGHQVNNSVRSSKGNSEVATSF